MHCYKLKVLIKGHFNFSFFFPFSYIIFFYVIEELEPSLQDLHQTRTQPRWHDFVVGTFKLVHNWWINIWGCRIRCPYFDQIHFDYDAEFVNLYTTYNQHISIYQHVDDFLMIFLSQQKVSSTTIQ